MELWSSLLRMGRIDFDGNFVPLFVYLMDSIVIETKDDNKLTMWSVLME